MTMVKRRGPWSSAEDQRLMSFIHADPTLNWVNIAVQVQSRTPKQCRERYHQNLKNSLNHSPITAAEGAQINEFVRKHGKRWADIARQLQGRSDNAVKNWWNGNQNRIKRAEQRRRAAEAAPAAAHMNAHLGQFYERAPSHHARRSSMHELLEVADIRSRHDGYGYLLPPLQQQAQHQSQHSQAQHSQAQAPPQQPYYAADCYYSRRPSLYAGSATSESDQAPPSLVSDHGSPSEPCASTTVWPSPEPLELPPLLNMNGAADKTPRREFTSHESSLLTRYEASYRPLSPIESYGRRRTGPEIEDAARTIMNLPRGDRKRSHLDLHDLLN